MSSVKIILVLCCAILLQLNTCATTPIAPRNVVPDSPKVETNLGRKDSDSKCTYFLNSLRCSDKATLDDILTSTSSLSTLDWLDCKECSIPELTREFFNNKVFSKLTIIRINKSGVTNIESRAFANLKALEELDLEFNELTTLDGEIFYNQEKLKELYMNNNNILKVDKPFRYLNSLVKLDMGKEFYKTNMKNDLFVGLDSITKIELNNIDLDNLEPEYFKGLDSLKVLNLKENKITSLKTESFKYLTNLNQLDLKDNPIKEIQNGAFIGLNSLKTLEFPSSMELPTLRGEMFQGLTSLTKLDLTHRNIFQIINSPTTSLNQLQELDLSYNNIEVFTVPFECENLKELQVSNNQRLKSVKLNKKNKLNRIDISKNRITELTNDIINLKTLNYLDLRYNLIENFDAALLVKNNKAQLNAVLISNNNWMCSNLREVVNVLQENYIIISKFDETIPPGVPNVKGIQCYYEKVSICSVTDENKLECRNGATLENITTFVDTIVMPGAINTFNCNKCNLPKLTENIFANIGLTNLQDIAIINSFVETIESKAFNNLKTLKTLSLSSNNLRKIEKEQFYKLETLISLDLTNNDILEINRPFSYLKSLIILKLDKKFYEDHMQKNLFTGLSSMRDLDLSDSNLSELGSEYFSGLNNLQTLNLANNKFRVIESGVFQELTNLHKLDLDGNSLQSIESEAFLGLEKVTTLILPEFPIPILYGDRFEGLSALRSIDLSDRHIKSIVKSEGTNLPNLIELNLNNNEIAEFEMPFEATDLEKLYLTNNKRLTKVNLKDTLENLKLLDLSHNNIQSLSNDTLTASNKFQTINLNSNSLRNLDYKTLLENNNELKSVFIEQNDWYCESLELMIAEFEKHNIEYKNEDDSNTVLTTEMQVKGITCSDKKDDDDDGDDDGDGDGDNAASTMQVAFVSISIVVINIIKSFTS